MIQISYYEINLTVIPLARSSVCAIISGKKDRERVIPTFAKWMVGIPLNIETLIIVNSIEERDSNPSTASSFGMTIVTVLVVTTKINNTVMIDVKSK